MCQSRSMQFYVGKSTVVGVLSGIYTILPMHSHTHSQTHAPIFVPWLWKKEKIKGEKEKCELRGRHSD
jgi:hypothetical protein